MKGRRRTSASLLTQWLGKNHTGYTIIEVLIALSVSMGLFVAIAFLLSGKQADARFQQAIKTYETEIQNVISETYNGYYRTEIVCTVSIPGGPGAYNFTSGVQNPGANRGCLFAGKILVPRKTDGYTEVLTVVSRQYTPNSNEEIVENFVDSQPKVIPEIYNVDDKFAHGFQLEIEKIVNSFDGSTLQSFGFFLANTGGYATPTFGGSSGRVELYGISGNVSDGAAPRADTANRVDTIPTQAFALPEGLEICAQIDDGGVHKAQIKIGGNIDQTGIVTTVVKDFNGDCA